MSINHINTNELDANFKSLKINNSTVSLPVKDNYYYTLFFYASKISFLVFENCWHKNIKNHKFFNK